MREITKPSLATNALFSLAIAIAASVLFPTEASAAPPPGYCDVKVCNKLERYSLSPSKWIGDKLGETCQPALLAKEDAVEGKVLDSKSKWFQGSFNITKASVTRVKEVKTCTPAAPGTR